MPDDPSAVRRPSSQWRVYADTLLEPLRIIRRDPLAMTGFVILCLLILVALFAPLIATHDPHEMHDRVEGVVLSLSSTEGQRHEVISEVSLNAVVLIGPGEIVAVGEAGTIMHSRQGRWAAQKGPVETDLLGISGAEETLYVVGEAGVILERRGGQWKSLPSPTDVRLRSVSLASPDAGLIVGDSGTVLALKDGQWEPIDTKERADLAAVSLLEPGFGFIAGDRGTLLRYQDGVLSRERVMSFRDLNDVHVFSRNFALAVGARGTILIYDGVRWQESFSPETRNLRSVRIVDQSSAFATGPFGVVLTWDGRGWAKLDLPYRRSFRGLGVVGDGVLAVGSDPFVDELSPPTRKHWLGTTHLGRDIFSQVVYGSRTALMVGLLAAAVVNLIGVNVGLVAGYLRGKIDDLLMRIVDIMYALPLEPFAMILVMIFDPSIWIIILAVGLLTWRTNARVIRSQVLSIARRPFIKAARVAGAGSLRIMYVHIAPNILPLAFLQLAVAAGYAITAEATLSFLGLGPPRIYSWGTILHAARLSGAWRTAWWWILPPGMLIMVTVVSIFFIARALEILSNPRLKREA
jgi:peptide/nickel transport system permease protein